MLKYFLHPIQLKTPNSPKYSVRTIHSGKITRKELSELLSYGSTITPSDCEAVLSALESFLERNLSQGKLIDLGFLRFSSQVKGSFQKDTGKINSKQLSVGVKVLVNKKFQKKVEHLAKLKKTSEVSPKPILRQYLNNTINSKTEFRPGDILSISGKDLQTIYNYFFVSKKTNQFYKINKFYKVGRGNLTLVIPELPKGEYEFRIQDSKRNKFYQQYFEMKYT